MSERIKVFIIFNTLLSFINIENTGYAKFHAGKEEIRPYIEGQVKIHARRFDIPEELLKGLIAPYSKQGRPEQLAVSRFAEEEILNYLRTNKSPYLSSDELTEASSINRFLNLVSISLKINYEKIERFFRTNGFEISEKNIWVFSSISYLFGFNTSLEIINFYSQLNSPGFLRYMLTDETLINKYLCDSKTLCKCFTGTLEPDSANKKKDKLLEFFTIIKYCKENKYEKTSLLE